VRVGSAPSLAAGRAALGRPLVAGLVVSSVLLSVVSWYTTERGMGLYLSPWLALLASLGVQSALVLVAWLIGTSEGPRGLLVAVYAITAFVSVAFSYVSLYGWFAARERPAQIERQLFDALQAATGQAQVQLTAAVAEAERHALALEEMAGAEKAHGFISRATDSDPWLAAVREAVAREAASYAGAYPEGQGAGLRYTAFDRHAALARQTLERLRRAAAGLQAVRATLEPLQPTADQLRAVRAAWDAIPWDEVRETLHAEVAAPTLPAYGAFVDRPVSGQEELLVAFGELFGAPGRRHLLALALAAFIDLVVFLLAWASGPHLFGAPEQAWLRAAAALDAADEQVFARGLLRRTVAGPDGLPRLEERGLSAGERQLCLALVARGLAAITAGDEGARAYLLDPGLHRRVLESLAERGLALQAARVEAAQGASG
jgi:hypothetical protein